MASDDRCLNCNATVRVINYALGPQLMHVDPHAGFPSREKGTAWWHCKQQVATLDPGDFDGGDAR